MRSPRPSQPSYCPAAEYPLSHHCRKLKGPCGLTWLLAGSCTRHRIRMMVVLCTACTHLKTNSLRLLRQYKAVRSSGPLNLKASNGCRRITAAGSRMSCSSRANMSLPSLNLKSLFTVHCVKRRANTGTVISWLSGRGKLVQKDVTRCAQSLSEGGPARFRHHVQCRALFVSERHKILDSLLLSG